MVKDIFSSMNIEELIKDCDIVTLIEFKNYLIENLKEICSSKNSNSKIVSNYKQTELVCNVCGFKLNKNGKTKNGVQKYICPNCRHTCSGTTGTITYHSKLSFEVWSNVIDNLINGFSIRRIAYENNISIPTSFNLRHKVLLALDKFINNIRIDNAQADEKYFKINLKGTKPQNMPRVSKKRTSTKSPYKGISHHKICVVSVIDENDNLIFKIGGLGRGTTNMLESCLSSHLGNIKTLTSDSATAYIEFCNNHNIKLISIPSHFHSDGINNLAEINGVHSQLETWMKKFRGVSTRHLQQYLNWFSYIFMMKKRFELKKLKLESYKNIIIDNNYIKANSIFKIPMPIDLNIAYAEYHKTAISHYL